MKKQVILTKTQQNLFFGHTGWVDTDIYEIEPRRDMIQYYFHYDCEDNWKDDAILVNAEYLYFPEND